MPAFGHFRGHRWVEHQPPGVERRVGHERLDHLLVVADAVGPPRVDHAVRIVGVVQGHPGHELRVHVLEIRQLRFVERQIDAGLDLALEIRGRRHDDVESAVAREQTGLQRFIGVEVGDMHLDAGLFLEIRQGVGRQIVRPDVQVQHPAGAGGAGRLGRGISAAGSLLGPRFAATTGTHQKRASKRKNRRPTKTEHQTHPL